MKVKDRMTPNPKTTAIDASVGDVWRYMKEHHLRRVPVMDRGKLVGIITRNNFGARPDLNLRGSSMATRYFTSEEEQQLSKMKVRDIIPTDQELITVDQEAYIEQAARLMRDNKIEGLPVVDENGQLVGIITESDIFDSFLEMLGINRKGTRINLRIEDKPEDMIRIGQILAGFKVKIANLVTQEIKGEKSLLILRINTTESKLIVDALKAEGFEVEAVIVKQ